LQLSLQLSCTLKERAVPQYSGYGAGFVPDTLNTKIYDEIIELKTIMLLQQVES
jgi:hypothetical protein